MSQMSQLVISGSKPRKAAPVIILRSVPTGFNWGWFNRGDPRMHLQTVDRKNRNRYKVWLEKNGKRVFEAVGNIPVKILKALEAEVREQRRHIEGRWTELMIENGWLTLNMSGRKVTLAAYPTVPGARFARTFDIADYFVARYDPTSAIKDKRPIKPEDLVLSEELAAIEVFPQKEESRRHHLFLPTILWED